jgi:RNA polymerase sigma-70 factor, ECF subfamily
MDELTLLALAARAGDRVATTAFVRRTQPEVWRVCARLGDRADADDLTQEVYVRALPALATFRGDSSARTWLLQIARYVCADHVRGRTRRRSLLDRLVLREAVAAPATGERTGELDLDDLIGRLDADRREAFVLTQVAGLPYAEAALVCEVPIGTIRVRTCSTPSSTSEASAQRVRSASSKATWRWPLLPTPLPPSIPSRPVRSENRPPASARITGIGPTS